MTLACACGDGRFRVRIDRDQQVGLLTCHDGHHSLLLDSSDYWDDVVQDGKPREKRCTCRERDFHVRLVYDIRDDGDVRSVTVELHCIACKKHTVAATFEIDYSPTNALIDRPLEPCDEPWLVPKRTELTGLWLPSDLDDVIRFLGETAHCYVAGFQEAPRLAPPAEIISAITDSTSFQLFFATHDLAFPANLRDSWKKLPAIHISAPTKMQYETGLGHLYYVQWADEYIVDRRIVPQEPELLGLADRLQAWMRSRFTSKRGKRTFDNPSEYERLEGGW